MTIRPVGAEFHADRQTNGRTDRQTDMTKLTVTFRNFANAPKMQHIKHTNVTDHRPAASSVGAF